MIAQIIVTIAIFAMLGAAMGIVSGDISTSSLQPALKEKGYDLTSDEIKTAVDIASGVLTFFAVLISALIIFNIWVLIVAKKAINEIRAGPNLMVEL